MDFLHSITLPTSPVRFFHIALTALGSIFFLLLRSFASKPVKEAEKANEDFDINCDTGFMPPNAIGRLPPDYDFWERSLADANEHLALANDETPGGLAKREKGEIWRQRIRAGPVISTRLLERDESKLRRAHLVLGWLVNFYVHSSPEDADPNATSIIVPRQLAVPLVAVSKALRIAPILTFADTVLWNMAPIDPTLPISTENMRFLHLFSGLEDEHAFYHMSAAVELRGAEVLHIIEDCNRMLDVKDINTVSKISRGLSRLADIVKELTDIMESVRPNCDPHSFYWAVRPWFSGSGAEGPGSPSWIYEGVEDNDKLDLSGPSAGQSTMMHAIDVWIDVDHKMKKRRFPAPSQENKRADIGFMEKMRRYMPGIHRDYLEHLERHSIREFVSSTPALRESYNNAVMVLKKHRDAHIRIACLYVLSMSKSSRAKGARCPLFAKMDAIQHEEVSRSSTARGTGGSELSKQLKAGRDATARTVLA